MKRLFRGTAKLVESRLGRRGFVIFPERTGLPNLGIWAFQPDASSVPGLSRHNRWSHGVSLPSYRVATPSGDRAGINHR
jgi:hypothetical protein